MALFEAQSQKKDTLMSAKASENKGTREAKETINRQGGNFGHM